MTETVLLRMRSGERRGAKEELASWRKDWTLARMLDQFLATKNSVESLIRKCVEIWQEDAKFFNSFVSRSSSYSQSEADEANELLQSLLDQTISMLDEIRGLILDCGKMGIEIDNADELDRLTEEYEKWKRDLPDLLAMRSDLLRPIIEHRIKSALKNPPAESDWEELFAE